MALVARQEREAISRRTGEALAAAGACGVRPGNPNGAPTLHRAGKGGEAIRQAATRNAGRHVADAAAVVAELQHDGQTTLRATAAALNSRGILTRRGGSWLVSSLRNLLVRVDRSG
ncbi:resolvase [Puniceibacterium confluentis]|uniref:resolvase n=1 Tax=Puniceibacterium confluentis TaxID=1958944 RepID=UPI001647C295|nr:resolvase [Puniceibacterium confluentis]